MNRFELACTEFSTNARCVSLLMAAVFFIGCGGNPHPVKVNVAEETLITTMDAWKEGKMPETLAEETPPVVVQDMEWAGGAKLLDYQVLDGAKPVDANLIAKVKLKLSNAEGKETEKTVTYVVGTSPKLTVFRDIMH